MLGGWKAMKSLLFQHIIIFRPAIQNNRCRPQIWLVMHIVSVDDDVLKYKIAKYGHQNHRNENRNLTFIGKKL